MPPPGLLCAVAALALTPHATRGTDVCGPAAVVGDGAFARPTLQCLVVRPQGPGLGSSLLAERPGLLKCQRPTRS